MRTARRLVAVVGLMSLVLVACSSDGGSEVASPASSTSVVASSPTPVDPDTGIGDTVTITENGFAPGWLLAQPGQAITFRNETDTTWSVVFDNQQVRSGPIEPGATFTWTSPTPISITYHAGNAPTMRGKIQVQSV